MKSVLVYGAAAFFPRIYAFLAVFIFSRVLSVHDFGLYVLAIAVGEFCDFTASLWFRVGFLRFYHPGTARSQSDKLDLNATYRVTLFCVCGAILLAWASALILVPDQWLTFAIVASLYAFANGTVAMSLATLRGEGRLVSYLIIEVLRPLSNLSLGLAAVKVFHATFAAAAYGVFGSNAMIGLLVFAITWLRRANTGGRDRVNEVLRYAWPLVLSCVLAAAMNAADRYQLQWWLGPKALALYAAAYTIGRQPIDILFTALNIGTFSELMRRYDADGAAAATALMGRQIAMMFGISFPAVVGVSLLAPDILHVFFDQRYWAGTAELVPVIALMALLAGLKSYGYDQGFYMVHRTRAQVLSMLPAVIVGVCVSAVLINIFGLSGAAYGGCVGYGASLFLSRMLVRRALPGSLPWVDISKIVIATLLMAVAVEISHRAGVHDKVGLIRTVVIGATVYATAIFSLNVLGLRRVLQVNVAAYWPR